MKCNVHRTLLAGLDQFSNVKLKSFFLQCQWFVLTTVAAVCQCLGAGPLPQPNKQWTQACQAPWQHKSPKLPSRWQSHKCELKAGTWLLFLFSMQHTCAKLRWGMAVNTGLFGMLSSEVLKCCRATMPSATIPMERSFFFSLKLEPQSLFWGCLRTFSRCLSRFKGLQTHKNEIHDGMLHSWTRCLLPQQSRAPPGKPPKASTGLSAITEQVPVVHMRKGRGTSISRGSGTSVNCVCSVWEQSSGENMWSHHTVPSSSGGSLSSRMLTTPPSHAWEKPTEGRWKLPPHHPTTAGSHHHGRTPVLTRQCTHGVERDLCLLSNVF